MIYKSLLSSVCLIILFVACSVRESWPPKTTGPNLPVRYCDINKEDKDKTIIGYALVDTSAVNWLVSIIFIITDKVLFTTRSSINYCA